MSRASHERDVTRYEEEVTQLKAANEATKKDLSQRLEDISAKLLQQVNYNHKLPTFWLKLLTPGLH